MNPITDQAVESERPTEEPALTGPRDLNLRRWQVYFGSGSGWYAVGEFVALDAASAIQRAIEIFGPGKGCRAEEIPWDTAPLPRLTARSPRSVK